MSEINETYQASETQTLATAAAANTLIDKLVALESQESMTTGEAALYAQTVEQLRTMMPDLNLEIDEQTGLLIGGADALRYRQRLGRKTHLHRPCRNSIRPCLRVRQRR